MMVDTPKVVRDDTKAFSTDVEKLLTQLCFPYDPDQAPSLAESILVLGTSKRECQRTCASDLCYCCKHARPRRIFIVGKGSMDRGLTEAEEILTIANFTPTFISRSEVLLGRSSNNTLQNIDEAVGLGLASSSAVLIVAKAHHVGRALLTAKKKLPDIPLQGWGYSFTSSPYLMSKVVWNKDPWSQNLVWQEFLKIRLYGRRGDIDYPQETKSIVDSIEKIIVDKLF